MYVRQTGYTSPQQRQINSEYLHPHTDNKFRRLATSQTHISSALFNMAYHASTCFDAGLFFLFELVTMIQTKTTAELSYSILYGV